MHTDYIISVSLFLIGLIIRTTYELLKKAGMVNPRSRILFSAIFLSMCLLWTSWFSMCPLDPLHLILPITIRLIGLTLLTTGLILAIGALVQLRGLESIDHLVTTGLFSLIRHPMYTGFILWIIGWALYHGALVSFLIGVIGIANILYWRQLEENKLISTYGENYLLYRKRTRL